MRGGKMVRGDEGGEGWHGKTIFSNDVLGYTSP